MAYRARASNRRTYFSLLFSPLSLRSASLYSISSLFCPFFHCSFYGSAISSSSSSHRIPVYIYLCVRSILSSLPLFSIPLSFFPSVLFFLLFWSKSDAINQGDYKASTAGDCSLFWVLRDEKLCIGRRYRKMKRSSCIIQAPLACPRLQASIIRAALYAASPLICLSLSRRNFIRSPIDNRRACLSAIVISRQAPSVNPLQATRRDPNADGRVY